MKDFIKRCWDLVVEGMLSGLGFAVSFFTVFLLLSVGINVMGLGA